MGFLGQAKKGTFTGRLADVTVSSSPAATPPTSTADPQLRRRTDGSKSANEEAAGILALGLASIEAAMTDMADGHTDNELLVRSMFSKIQPAPHDGDGTAQ
ncbi:hypothetical protein ACFWD7_29730 [Streptomyces mirabilis]|uniref:hypothetical protein n=1 Tax=Streptomyces mirabilis TaxID=68239 RepID=UPI0021C09DB9|nr:hypothetical protein [Streptomyces mirabilis]MCT9109641.1 hypothetical protein [Streptomyces mirabilis]